MEIAAHLRALPPVAVVYTDLDGTLLGAGGSVLADADGRPSLAAVEALVAARQVGIAVVAVTGRRAPQAEEDVRILGLDGAIAEAGAVRVADGGVSVRWGRCPRSAGPTPRAAMARAGALDAVINAFPGRIRPYAPWDEGRLGGHLLHGRIDVATANAVLVEAGLGWAHVVDNGVTAGWPELGDVRAYHLIPQGVGKAAAVAADLAARGLTGGEAMGIGDSAEDGTLAGVVATYVAVAGGHVPAAANAFPAAQANGAGVAEAVAAAMRARARPG